MDFNNDSRLNNAIKYINCAERFYNMSIHHNNLGLVRMLLNVISFQGNIWSLSRSPTISCTNRYYFPSLWTAHNDINSSITKK